MSALSNCFARTSPFTLGSARLRYSSDSGVEDHGSPVIYRSVFQSDPNISSIKTSTMITTANSLLRESGMPNHLDDALVHAMSGYELSRVRTELQPL
jgi:hypothetical protein